MNNRGIQIIFLCFVLILTECKTKEKIIERKIYPDLSTEELEKLIFRETDEINTLKLRKIHFIININDQKYDLNGTVGIIKDSIIVMSFVPLLGYEIARVYCTGDMLIIIDRRNKHVYQGSIKEQLKRFNLNGDYSFIQELLLNQAVICDYYMKNTVYEKNTKREGNYYYYTIETSNDEMIVSRQRLKIRSEDLLNENMMFIDFLLDRRVVINYGDFQNFEKFVFPKTIEISMIASQKVTEILIKIGNIEINSEINAKMNLPDSYKRMELSMDQMK